jgi:hypothetical protein
MWRPRDRERFIGGYDPEHEMPDPDRDRGERWQSDAYRHNARDSRFAYRWDPDRIESRYPDRDRGRYEGDVNRDARYRQSFYTNERQRSPWEGGGRDDYGYGREPRDDYRRSTYGDRYASDFDRDRDRENFYGSDRDRGYEYDRERHFDRGGYDYGYDAGRGRHGRSWYDPGDSWDRPRSDDRDRGWDVRASWERDFRNRR